MNALSKAEKEQKLRKLAEREGFNNIEDMLEAAVADSVCPGICTVLSCEYTTEVEPDQRSGWGECGHGNSIMSALVLAGII